MTNLNFDKESTAVLVVEPYTASISEGGNYGTASGVAEANDTVDNMSQVVAAERKAGLRIF